MKLSTNIILTILFISMVSFKIHTLRQDSCAKLTVMILIIIPLPVIPMILGLLLPVVVRALVTR
uniref:Uncharacterized protein n=1 Tax=Brassica oleracea TaxID=3712 RepID=A0A3P6DMB0_BRAOL|nr:unnamed protein product [Brassica oleracea]